MPAKNVYHDAVVAALQADGWTVTHDPLTLKVGERDLHVDLGAERLPLAAERNGERIAVEVQSFSSPSPVADLQHAVGQFTVYRLILADQQPDRELFLAITEAVYDGILSEELGTKVLRGAGIRALVFNPLTRRIVRWIK